MRGRKPVARNIKLVTGNPGRRPLKNQPEPKSKAPSVPDFLHKYAKSEWKRISKDLDGLGLLTKVDRAALAAYCQAYARWRQAEEGLESSGLLVKTVNGNVVQSPLVGVANRAMDLMCKFLTEFGMTPSSRCRIEVKGESSGESKEAKYFDPSQHPRNRKRSS